jgi:iron uptake system component EfeO
MANNVEGSEQAYADLQPAIRRIDPALSTNIEQAFTALDTVLDKYRTTSNVSGYVLFTDLTNADKRALSAAVKAVAEPLSGVAGKVANG